MKIYKPENYETPYVIDVTSAWGNIPSIIKDIIDRFNVPRDIACEIGVERGFSTSVLANYFRTIVGVDTFDWDFGDGADRSFYGVSRLLKNFRNIHLVKDDCLHFIDNEIYPFYDLIHIDVGYETHEYELTKPCAEWAVKHTNCILFHDTISFPEIGKLCQEIADQYGFEYWNYEEDCGLGEKTHCGLGILIRKPL